MNVHPVSTPTLPGAPKRFGLNPYVFVVAGVLLVVGLLALGLYAGSLGDSDHADPTDAMAPPASASDVKFAPSGPSAPAPRTTYIVGSEADAMTLEADIAEVNAISRHVFGEEPLVESVVVITDDALAEAFAEAIAQGNLILVGLGLPEDRVVDLRGN